MRKFNFLQALLFLLLSATAGAQKVPPFLGTKTPYQPQQEQHTLPPAGYKPIFINHVGRHGARFMTKAGTEEKVLQLLRSAEERKALTPLGIRLAGVVGRLAAIEKGNYELISALGKEEQAAIGARIRKGYREAFKGRGLEVVTTYKVRTKQSAEAFLQGLADYSGKKKYTMRPEGEDSVLRFYDLSAAYLRYKKSKAVQAPIDSLNRDLRMGGAVRHICARIFTPAFGVRLDSLSFAGDLYDLYCLQFSLSKEMGREEYVRNSRELGSAFGKEDLEWLDFVNGAQDFLEKGPGADVRGIQVSIATPLLEDFLASMDAAVSRKVALDAVLRFTHAEAISPFAALLGIPAASVPASSIYQYRRHWQAGTVIPLSANIQWILYSNGKDYLVKTLLNEKEVALPLPTTRYPYYRWEDVRAYYRRYLSFNSPLSYAP